MQINQENTSVNDITISIVGGTGGMGKLFAKIFKNSSVIFTTFFN